MMNTIDPKNALSQDIVQLFKENPTVYPGALGFPQDWQDEPLWQENKSI